jgi:hypothetical protein
MKKLLIALFLVAALQIGDGAVIGVADNTIAPQDCCNLPGDFNNDDGFGIGDVVGTINYIFKNGPPAPCPNEGDFNADCVINISDAVAGVEYIFHGGPAPQCGCVTPVD